MGVVILSCYNIIIGKILVNGATGSGTGAGGGSGGTIIIKAQELIGQGLVSCDGGLGRGLGGGGAGGRIQIILEEL